jgi:methenyltetrahydromethanopterin cyclohydrolase
MQQITRANLNDRSMRLLQAASLAELRLEKHELASGATIFDFGINTAGSLDGGILLSRICMADLAGIALSVPNYAIGACPILQVTTDHPLLACMASQYAGWPIKADGFFAMGSGPMRAKRGKEKLLEEISIIDESDCVVGVLETEAMPTDDVVTTIANDCGVRPDQVTLCVAPTTSIAGSLQIVARSVETALHKIHTIGGPIQSIVSAVGYAPLPPPANKFIKALGRTNDAILYGGHVVLWTNDSVLLDYVERIPSSASADHGLPFAELFAKYEYDFYKIDPNLFAPAMITVNDLPSGQSLSAGHIKTSLF